MKKILLSFLLITLIALQTEGQRRKGLISRRVGSIKAITFSVGPAHCFGDPFGSPYEKLFFTGTNWGSAIGFSETFNKTFGYRASFQYNNYSGSDGNVPKPHTGYYSFQSNLLEITTRGEYAYYFGRKHGNSTPNSIRGYLGLGAFRSVATFPEGKKVGKTSPTYGALIPFGAAYQYDIRNSNFSFGAELGWQFVLSDYVDGYNPNPNSKSNDVVTNLRATVAYRFF